MPEARRVLVVDDDDTIRPSLLIGLEGEGFDVRGARDGLEALAVLGAWRPDVILLDLMMPRMDGWAFRDEQRERGVALRTPLVIISAARNAAQHAALLDAAAVLEKPFDFDDLLRTLDRLAPTSGAGV